MTDPLTDDEQAFADSVNQSSLRYRVNAQRMVDAFNLFIGNRYKVLQDFIELDESQNTTLLMPKETKE